MKSNRVIDFRHAPPSRWTCISRPDDKFKTVIREDGALLYDYVQPIRNGRLQGGFHTEIGFKLLVATSPLEVTQVSDDPQNSIVVTTLRYRFATLTLHSFGYAEPTGRRTDIVLWRIQATSGAKQFVAGLAVAPIYHRYRVSDRGPHRAGSVANRRAGPAPGSPGDRAGSGQLSAQRRSDGLV